MLLREFCVRHGGIQVSYRRSRNFIAYSDTWLFATGWCSIVRDKEILSYPTRGIAFVERRFLGRSLSKFPSMADTVLLRFQERESISGNSTCIRLNCPIYYASLVQCSNYITVESRVTNGSTSTYQQRSFFIRRLPSNLQEMDTRVSASCWVLVQICTHYSNE